MKKNRDQFIEGQIELFKVAESLEKEKIIGVDLEGDSMFHYHEKVCLLQISTQHQNFLIDPLSISDLSPLMDFFRSREIIKVFHGADYDIRSLYRDFNIEVNSLFDTQIAASFLGYKELSLASLLRDKFGINTEKKYQKKDWSQRPLSPSMLSYAVQDSSHLIPLSRILKKELQSQNRLFCVKEECELLSKVRPAQAIDAPLFLKFKGAQKLDPRTRAVLEAILQLREKQARKMDRPPFKIMGNSAILEIAKRKPSSEQELKEIKGLSTKQIKKLGSSVLAKTEKAMNLKDNKIPEFPKKKKKTAPNKPGASEYVKKLKTWRDNTANKLRLEPAVVCTNFQIQSLVNASPETIAQLREISEIRNWQKKMFGKEICSILNTTI